MLRQAIGRPRPSPGGSQPAARPAHLPSPPAPRPTLACAPAPPRTPPAGGLDTELLEEELAAQQRRGGTVHGAPGLVSFLVKPRIEIVSKDKLVASKGKLITVTGRGGSAMHALHRGVACEGARRAEAGCLRCRVWCRDVWRDPQRQLLGHYHRGCARAG